MNDDAARRPNVVWITTHDINPHLGTYAGVYPGAEAAVTPRLDALAAEGARYDRAFASAPVCAPSRSSVITGCFPASIGTMHMRTKAVPPPEVKLLPEYFRVAGYYTFLSGSTDFQVATPRSAFDEVGDDAHWRNRVDPDQPFFAQFHGGITHESQLYLDEEAFRARTPNVPDEARHDPSGVALPPYHPDTDAFRTAWAHYLDLITEMDHWVGGILDQLAEDGLAENTLVVFWSDHGAGMPRAKRWATEAGLREPLIVRWPGRIPSGSVRAELVHLMDLAPTMLAACGLPVPPHMQGTTLWDDAGRFAESPNAYAYGSRDRMDEQEDMDRTIRDERYRYIRHYHPDRSAMQYCAFPDGYATWSDVRRLRKAEGDQLSRGGRPDVLTPLQRSLVAAPRPAEELYDLVADPHEERDLATDPAYEPVRRRLSDALDEWQERIGDLGLVPEETLLERWRPGGAQPTVPAPAARVRDGVVHAVTEVAGASIVWTTDPPAEPGSLPRLSHWLEEMGTPAPDGRRWRLLGDGTPPPADRPVWLMAERLGYRPSDTVLVTP